MLLEENVKEFLFECKVRKYAWKTIKQLKDKVQ